MTTSRPPTHIGPQGPRRPWWENRLRPQQQRQDDLRTLRNRLRTPVRRDVMGDAFAGSYNAFRQGGGRIEDFTSQNFQFRRGDRTTEALLRMDINQRKEFWGLLNLGMSDRDELEDVLRAFMNPQKPRTGWRKFLDRIETPIAHKLGKAWATLDKPRQLFYGGLDAADAAAERALLKIRHAPFTAPWQKERLNATFEEATGIKDLMSMPKEKRERLMAERFGDRNWATKMLTTMVTDPLTPVSFGATKVPGAVSTGLKAFGVSPRIVKPIEQAARVAFVPDQILLGGLARGTQKAAELATRGSRKPRVKSRPSLLPEAPEPLTPIAAATVRKGAVLDHPKHGSVTVVKRRKKTVTVRDAAGETHKVPAQSLTQSLTPAPRVDTPVGWRETAKKMMADSTPGPPDRPQLSSRVSDFIIKTQEKLLDTAVGMRMVATKATAAGMGVGKDIEARVITSPGVANAGRARVESTFRRIQQVAPDLKDVEIPGTLLMVRHLREVRNIKGAQRRLPEGMTATELDQFEAALKADIKPKLFEQAENAALELQKEYRLMLDEAVAAGFVKADVAKELTEAYPWYSPIRYIEDAAAGVAPDVTKRGLTDSGLKALGEYGKESQLVNPIYLYPDKVINHTVRAHYNTLLRDLIRTMKKLDEDNAGWFTEVKEAKPGPGTVSFFEDGVRQTYTVPEWLGRELDYFAKTAPSSNPLASFVRAFQHLGRAGLITYNPGFVVANGVFDSVVGGVTRGVLPWSSGKQIIRDLVRVGDNPTLELFDMSSAKGQRFYGAKNLEIDITLRPKEGEKFLDVKTGGRATENVNLTPAERQDIQIKRAKQFGVEPKKPFAKKGFDRDPRKLAKGFLNAVPRIGEAVEQGPRRALFERVMNKQMPGWADEIRAAGPRGSAARQEALIRLSNSSAGQQAAAEALEVTINFSRGGHWVSALNPYILFLRAAVGGSMQIPRATGLGGARIAGRSGRGASLRLGGLALGQFGLTSYNMTYPEYWDIPARERFTTVVVMLPSDEKDKFGNVKPNYYTPVPITRELAPVLGSATYLAEALFSENRESFGTLVNEVLQVTAPLGSHGDIPGPLAMKQGLDQIYNVKSFFNRPIVTNDLKNLPAEEQYNPYTSEAAKALGKLVNAAPNRLDHVLQGFTGTTGRNITSLTDWMLDQFMERETKADGLVQKLESLTSRTDKDAFRRGLSAEDRKLLDDEIRSEQGLPVISSITGRFRRVRRGGEIARKEREERGEPSGQELIDKILEERDTKEIKETAESLVGREFAGRLLGDTNIAASFRDRVSRIDRDAQVRSMERDRRYGAFSETDQAISIYNDFWENGTTPDYDTVAGVPSEKLNRALFMYYDAFRLASKELQHESGVDSGIDYDRLERLLSAAEDTWDKEQMEHVETLSRVARRAHPLLNDYDAFRRKLRDEGWWDLHEQSAAFEASSLRERGMYLDYLSHKDQGRLELDKWLQQHSLTDQELVTKINDEVDDLRDDLKESDAALESGLSRFFGHVARTVAGKAEIAQKIDPTQWLTVLTKGPNGSRLSIENELPQLRHRNIRTLEDLLSTSIYTIAYALNVKVSTIRRWGLYEQAEDILEVLDPALLRALRRD